MGLRKSFRWVRAALAGALLLGPGMALTAGQPALGEAEADPRERLTLEQAVERALQLNPTLEAAQRGREAAAARLGEARAARLPLLEFGETYTRSNNPVFAFGSLLEQGRFTERNFAVDSLNNPGSLSNFRSALNLRVPVFNRFQIASAIEQARLGEETASEAIGLVQQQLRFQVIQTYFGVLVAQARQKAAQHAVETAETEAGRIRNMVEQGLRVSSDQLAAEVQLANFRQQLIQAEGDVSTACAALSAVLGESAEKLFEVSGELSEKQFSPPSQSALIQQALAGRAELEQLRRGVEAAEQKVRAARGQYLPALNLFAQFGHSGQDFGGGSADFAVGARLTFNILDFGRPERVRQAEAERGAAKAMLRQRSNEVSLEAVQAYRTFLTAQQRVEVAAGAVGQAAETLRIVRDRHEAGLTAITELLRAQTALLESEFNLLGARYDYYLGYARILLVGGVLTDVSSFAS